MNKPLTFEEWWTGPAKMSDSPLSYPYDIARVAWHAAQANMPQHTDAQWIERTKDSKCDAPYWMWGKGGMAFTARKGHDISKAHDGYTHYIPGDNNGRIPKPPVIREDWEVAFRKKYGLNDTDQIMNNVAASNFRDGYLACAAEQKGQDEAK